MTGRKSLAYALRFRAADRTLTVDEASAARDAAVALAGERTGAVLRGSRRDALLGRVVVAAHSPRPLGRAPHIGCTSSHSIRVT